MNPNLLLIDSSARLNRSATRLITARLAAAWQQQHPDGHITIRDVGSHPPAAINESWIAAAYTPLAAQTSAHQTSLALSETLIAEIEAADALIIGAPLYNFGLPAPLKSWIEQIVRFDRTFEIRRTADGTETYRALLAPKPVIVVISAGNPAFLSGAKLQSLNFLRPQLDHTLRFLGLEPSFIEVEENAARSGALPASFAAAADQLISASANAASSRHLARTG